MEIKCEKSYGIPVYHGIATVTTEKATWEDNIRFRFKMAKLYAKRMFGLLKQNLNYLKYNR